MDGLSRDLIIAITGAVIGAAVVYLFSIGFQWGAKARESRRQQRVSDIADWKSGDAAKRQTIFNAYLFSVLKLFIIGSILTGVASEVSYLEPNDPGINNLDYVVSLVHFIGVLFYAATLGEILQFTKLVRKIS
jgi:hypothetical protein